MTPLRSAEIVPDLDIEADPVTDVFGSSLRAALRQAPVFPGVDLLELEISANLPSIRPSSTENIVAQCAIALTTAAVSLRKRTVFFLVLKDDGVALQAPNIVVEQSARKILGANVLCKFVLCPELLADGTKLDSEYVALWIDDPSAPDSTLPSGRFHKSFFQNYPMLDDYFYQRRVDRGNRRLNRYIQKSRNALPPEKPWPAWGGKALRGHKKPVLFFLVYWLDMGGAELFALETIIAAKKSGFDIVIISDQTGRHRIAEKFAKHTSNIYLLANFSCGVPYDAIFLALLEHFRPVIVHCHHSYLAYRVLPLLRLAGHVRHVIDTTHILEHRDGGFVKQSLLMSNYIDMHHVISKDLKNY